MFFLYYLKQAAMWEPLLKQNSLKLAKYWLKAVYNSQLLVFGADIYLLWSCLLLLLFIIWPHPFFQLSASNMEQCLRQPWSNLSNLLIPLIITQPLFYPLIIPPETSTAHIDRNQCMTSACLQKKKKKPLKRMKAKQIKPKYDSKCFIRVNKWHNIEQLLL